MVKLIKQLPLVALLLAFTVFVGKAAVQALSTSSTTMWSFDQEQQLPETNPAAYKEAPNATDSDCDPGDEVCLIRAPEAPGGGPDLTDLLEAIENHEEHEDITYGVYIGN